MFFLSIKLNILYFLVPVVLFIHEMEEWNIHKFHLENYTNRIQGETILSIRLWLFFLSIFGFCWTIMCYFIPNRTVSIVLMMLLIDFTLLNAIQHIGITIKVKKYNPGLIFGGIISLMIDILFIINIIQHEVIPLWAVILLLLWILPILAESAVSVRKNKIPKTLEWIIKFSAKLEKVMSE